MIPLLIGALAPLLGDILKRVLPAEKMSEEERTKLENQFIVELAQQDFSALENQLKINLEEAKNPNMFVAGWRPFCGWVCGCAFAYNFILQPFLVFGVGVFRLQLPPFPVLDIGPLMTVLLGLLGLGTLRTVEKLRDKDRTPNNGNGHGSGGPNPGFWNRVLGRDNP